MTTQTITVKIPYDAYNQRRYGKPWGARITLDENQQPQYDFTPAYYAGNDMGGIMRIVCMPGDIIATGQKDYRKINKSFKQWYIVRSEEQSDCISVNEAIDYLCEVVK